MTHAPSFDPTASYADELSILGLAFLDPAAVPVLLPKLPPEAFANDAYRTLWGIFCRELPLGEPIRLDALAGHLQRSGRLDNQGGLVGIGETYCRATANAPTLVGADRLVGNILDHAARRSLRAVAYDIVREAESPTMPGRDALNWAAGQLLDLLRVTHTGDLANMPEAIDEALSRISERQIDPLAHRGTPHGLPGLEALMPALVPGNLIVVGGRPSLGKTSVALAICAHAARESGEPVHFASLEQRRHELAERFLAAHSDIPLQVIREGLLEEADFTQLRAARDAGERVASLWLDDQPGQPLLRIAAQARRLQARAGGRLALVCIDYLGLLKVADRRVPRHEQFDELVRECKNLAGELNAPVVLLAQVNRESEKNPGKRPTLANLYGSSGIEAHADAVLLLHRPEIGGQKQTGSEVILELLLEKQRNGPIGEARVKFDRARMRFAACVHDPFPG